MKLYVISPLSKKTVDIAWIELNTAAGNFVIQTGHAPTIMTLAANKEMTICLTNGKQETYVIRQGIAEITRENVTLILSENL